MQGVLCKCDRYPSRAGVIQYTSPQPKILTVSIRRGQAHESDEDAGAKAELLSLKKKSSTDPEPSTNLKGKIPQAKPIEVIWLRPRKYCQTSLLKKQVDVSIQKLTTTVIGPGATDVARMRLELPT